MDKKYNFVFRLYQEDNGQFNSPIERTNSNIVKTFEETRGIRDRVRCVHHRGMLAADNIAAVNSSVVKDPELRIRHHPHSLGPFHGSLWRILH